MRSDTAFEYQGFTGDQPERARTANAIVALMLTGGDSWKCLFRSDSDPVTRLPEALAQGLMLANQGYLVVAGLAASGGEHGHVALLVTGEMIPSGSWDKAKLARRVPPVAQAGGPADELVFSGKSLASGISPSTYRSGNFVLCARQERQ